MYQVVITTYYLVITVFTVCRYTLYRHNSDVLIPFTLHEYASVDLKYKHSYIFSSFDIKFHNKQKSSHLSTQTDSKDKTDEWREATKRKRLALQRKRPSSQPSLTIT